MVGVLVADERVGGGVAGPLETRPSPPPAAANERTNEQSNKRPAAPHQRRHAPLPTPPPQQENELSGPLPASARWRALHTLRAGSNTFGAIPEALYSMPALLMLDAMANQLSAPTGPLLPPFFPF